MTMRGIPIARWLAVAAGGTTIGGAGLLATSDEAMNTAHGIVRFGRAALTVSKIVVDYKRTLYSGNLIPDTSEYNAAKSQVHKRSADKLLELCCVNGGTFIKIGQHLGSLDYLLPVEYVTTLKVLHSEAPKSHIDSVMAVLRQELKIEPSEVFRTFSPVPVGTASLAQVHEATTMDGTRVAVKVQHSSVREHSKVDFKTMEVLFNIVAYLFPEFQFDWLVQLTKHNLPLELDFEHEARNAEKAAAMFSQFSWLKVPTVDWSLTTSRVLTMEFCEGGQVNDPVYMQEHGISPVQVSERLGLLYSEMIFCKGYVHSDPHPGNVLVSKMKNGDAQIILLDHGLYARDEVSKNATALVAEIIAALGRMNREVVLLLKTNDLLRGIEFSLNIQHSQKSFLTMSRSCVRSVYSHQRAHCTSIRCRLSCTVRQTIDLLRIDGLALYLALSTSFENAVTRVDNTSFGYYARGAASAPGVRELLRAGCVVANAAVWCVWRLVGGVVLLLTGGRRAGASSATYTTTNLDSKGRIVEEEVVVESPPPSWW